MVQPVSTKSALLVAKSAIIMTAEASEPVPARLAPILGMSDLARVKELTLSNLRDENGKLCATCAKTVHLRVDVVLKYSDTAVRFIRTGGMEITMERGAIGVAKVPFQPVGKTFTACGSATCSSIKLQGINIRKLEARAKELGYMTASSRRG